MDEDLIEQPDNQGLPEGQDHVGDTGAPEGDAAPAQPSAAAAFLDTITESGEGTAEEQAQRARDAAGRFVSQGDAAPAQTAVPGAQPPAGAAAPAPQPPAQARTPEQEDADLLAGIKSERGRARVQKIIEARNEAEGGLSAVREMVQAAGMTTETFGQHIEFSRLANSNDPQDLQRAAQMLEQTRADLYRKLGQDAPGVDALSDFPDLAQQVQNLLMPRETALEVARLRRDNQAVQAQRQQHQQAEQETQQFQQAVAQAQQSLESYVQTRAHEIDHPARMKALETYFADPRKLQEFATTYQPNQWPAAIRMLYDNVQVAQQQRRPPAAPISSRAGALGRPAVASGQSAPERLMSTIDNLGI
ncbi:hypothetical protein C4E15_06725 [Achromobacter spanius]|uniref:Uncharacterized protein n=1 Tax=Achromobacter spanius TaxID=217203 RepID=A0A2S5GUF6_9BURK|nr:hypothetical protein [Achromobacter spanius]PPA76483.1 hypothetical protein C4E15_06725 [Achromobacter spanius]